MGFWQSILKLFGKRTPAPAPLLPFDATLYQHKPTLTPGMDNTLLLPSGSMAFWLCNPRLVSLGNIEGMWDDENKLATVAKAAWAAGYTKFVMDDEGRDLGRIRRNLRVLRLTTPGMKLGAFCFPSIDANLTPEQVRAGNDKADFRAIMAACDFAVPGVDLRWDMSTLGGRAMWLARLKLGKDEAARIMPGKPCYPFLPFEYNSIVVDGDLSAAEMQWQLKQCQALSLQPIIWGGWTRTWSENLPWHDGVKKVYS